MRNSCIPVVNSINQLLIFDVGCLLDDDFGSTPAMTHLFNNDVAFFSSNVVSRDNPHVFHVANSCKIKFLKLAVGLSIGPTMTSPNGNIFRITGPLYGEFTGHRRIPSQRPVTRGFDVSFDLWLNKRLSKQSWGWWFETPSGSLWRHCQASLMGQSTNIKSPSSGFASCQPMLHLDGTYASPVSHINFEKKQSSKECSYIVINPKNSIYVYGTCNIDKFFSKFEILVSNPNINLRRIIDWLNCLQFPL